MPEVIEEVAQPLDQSISTKKLDANRRNAQLSTGPRTERGKKHSRRNPLKHGILASVLLVEDVEDAAAYEKLLYRLRQCFEPVGEMEEYLVEKLSACIWRERRAVFWEAEGLRQGEAFNVKLTNRLPEPPPLSGPCLSDPARVELLLRYRASVLTEIRVVLSQLERLQRARKGEHVPAPAEVHVSHD